LFIWQWRHPDVPQRLFHPHRLATMENTLYFQEYNGADTIRFPQSFLAHERLL
jgi:hypothetical protein